MHYRVKIVLKNCLYNKSEALSLYLGKQEDFFLRKQMLNSKIEVQKYVKTLLLFLYEEIF